MSGYPTPVSEQSGCKVGWLTYDNEADATVASELATKERARMALAGYDFGYQVPGEVLHRVNAETGEQTWVVTIP